MKSFLRILQKRDYIYKLLFQPSYALWSVQYGHGLPRYFIKYIIFYVDLRNTLKLRISVYCYYIIRIHHRINFFVCIYCRPAMLYICITPTQIEFLYFDTIYILCCAIWRLEFVFNLSQPAEIGVRPKNSKNIEHLQRNHNYFSVHCPKNYSFILDNNLGLKPNL